MKERPILFSAPMVRAILSGEKTQTRRVVKGLHEDAHGVQYWAPPSGRSQCGYASPGINYWTPRGNHIDPCPYGERGDRLWVRETFAVGEGLIYRAEWEENCPNISLKGLWKPSIFMPRAASRITLEITGLRVERLNSISEADARAEGIASVRDLWKGQCGDFDETLTDLQLFKILWESINGERSWDLNSWVWVVEFHQVALEAALRKGGQ